MIKSSIKLNCFCCWIILSTFIIIFEYNCKSKWELILSFIIFNHLIKSAIDTPSIIFLLKFGIKAIWITHKSLIGNWGRKIPRIRWPNSIIQGSADKERGWWPKTLCALGGITNLNSTAIYLISSLVEFRKVYFKLRVYVHIFGAGILQLKSIIWINISTLKIAIGIFICPEEFMSHRSIKYHVIWFCDWSIKRKAYKRLTFWILSAIICSCCCIKWICFTFIIILKYNCKSKWELIFTFLISKHLIKSALDTPSIILLLKFGVKAIWITQKSLIGNWWWKIRRLSCHVISFREVLIKRGVDDPKL